LNFSAIFTELKTLQMTITITSLKIEKQQKYTACSAAYDANLEVKLILW